MKNVPSAHSFARMSDELMIELIWNRMLSGPGSSIDNETGSVSVELHFELPQFVQDYFTDRGYVLDNYGTNQWLLTTP